MSHDPRHARPGRVARIRRSAVATVATALTAAVLTVADPAAGQPPVSGAPELLPDSGTTRFIVQLRATADLAPAARTTDREARGRYVYEQLTTVAETSQADLRAYLDRRDVRYTPLWIVNALVVEGDRALAEELTARHDVAGVEPDVEIPLPPVAASDPGPFLGWNLQDIRAPEAWEEFGVRGEGVVVAAIGTGADVLHPALVRQYRGNTGGGFVHDHNWFDATGGCPLAPCDVDGWSTHHLGVMVGDDGGGTTTGVAPDAQWIAVRACTLSSCSSAALLAAAQWLLAPTDLAGQNPDPTKSPHVVTADLPDGWGDTWLTAVINAWAAAGILPVLPAGDRGPACGTIGHLASLPVVYTVTGYDMNHRILPSASRGGPFPGPIKPDAAAPGLGIRSTFPGGGYATLHGTAVAAPHAAGVAALVWSARPSLVRDLPTTRFVLDTSAISVGDLSCGGTPDHNNVWGHGRLDAFEAVRLALTLP